MEEINTIVGATTGEMIRASSGVQDLFRMAQELIRVMEALQRNES